MNRILFLLILFLLSQVPTQAQETISLNECYTWAKENYPLIKQRDLIEKSAAYSLDNIGRNVWPQVNANAQLTYQSEVTSIPISLPGISFTPPGRDQYKVYVDVNQPITDLYTIKQQKELQKANAQVQLQNLETELYKLNERINQIYFGILLIDEQLGLNALLDKDLESGKKRIEAAIKYGVDFKSSQDKIEAELIKNQQRAIELRAQRKAYLLMLAYFINRNLSDNTTLQKPAALVPQAALNRPELTLWDKRIQALSVQERIIKNRNIPKLSFFVQSGFGRPSPLNMISNSFQPYYIGGLRASWSIANLYSQNNERSLLKIDAQNYQVQKEVFVFNTQLSLFQQNTELKKLTELINSDEKLVLLRNDIKNTSKVQLDNGVITATDYVREVNAADQARQNKLLHEMQMLITQYNIQNTSGN